MSTNEKTAEIAEKTAVDDKLAARAIEATVRCLEGEGYEILERLDASSCIQVVAKSPDGYVTFVTVKAALGELPDEVDMVSDPKGMEVWAAKWLMAHDQPDGTPARFDSVSFMVGNASRAMLRHHINMNIHELAELKAAEEEQGRLREELRAALEANVAQAETIERMAKRIAELEEELAAA